MKKLFLLVAVAGMFVACNNKPAENKAQEVDTINTEVIKPAENDTLTADSAAVIADSLAMESAK